MAIGAAPSVVGVPTTWEAHPAASTARRSGDAALDFAGSGVSAGSAEPPLSNDLKPTREFVLPTHVQRFATAFPVKLDDPKNTDIRQHLELADAAGDRVEDARDHVRSALRLLIAEPAVEHVLGQYMAHYRDSFSYRTGDGRRTVLVDTLGAGGQGTVELVSTERPNNGRKLDRLEALKQGKDLPVLPEIAAGKTYVWTLANPKNLPDKKALYRFHREVFSHQAIDARLNGDGSFFVPKMTRFGVHPTQDDDGRFGEYAPFIATDFQPGQTLAEFVQKTGSRLPIEAAADFLALGIAGIRDVHDEGIIHRDIKPDNLFLTNFGGVLVLDFGIAKLLSRPELEEAASLDEKTDANAVIGTLGWHSPEQARTDEVTFASDVHALIQTFYFSLTGEHIFENTRHEAETIISHGNKFPSDAMHRVSELLAPYDEQGEALAEVIKRAWDLQPLQRPTAEEVFAAIYPFTSFAKDHSLQRNGSQQPATKDAPLIEGFRHFRLEAAKGNRRMKLVPPDSPGEGTVFTGYAPGDKDDRGRVSMADAIQRAYPGVEIVAVETRGSLQNVLLGRKGIVFGTVAAVLLGGAWVVSKVLSTTPATGGTTANVPAGPGELGGSQLGATSAGLDGTQLASVDPLRRPSVVPEKLGTPGDFSDFGSDVSVKLQDGKPVSIVLFRGQKCELALDQSHKLEIHSQGGKIRALYGFLTTQEIAKMLDCTVEQLHVRYSEKGGKKFMVVVGDHGESYTMMQDILQASTDTGGKTRVYIDGEVGEYNKRAGLSRNLPPSTTRAYPNDTNDFRTDGAIMTVLDDMRRVTFDPSDEAAKNNQEFIRKWLDIIRGEMRIPAQLPSSGSATPGVQKQAHTYLPAEMIAAAQRERTRAMRDRAFVQGKAKSIGRGEPRSFSRRVS